METGREVDDMNQMEVKGAIAGDGSLILPPGVLETMGAEPGDWFQILVTTKLSQRVLCSNDSGR